MENDLSLHESSINRTSNDIAVIHDALSDPEISISETCPVVVPETLCTNTGLSSSQKDDVLLNAHEIIAVPTQKETENESSIIMKKVVLNGAHHSTTTASDECTYWGSLVVLPDMSCFNDSQAFDQISYKNEENLSDASNDDQELNKILIDADYPSDRLSTNKIFKRSDENVSQESNLNDLISRIADPHHLVSSSGLSTQ
ncbi:unnamed protein product [Schistosoma mattheei]|uniref:Uncharacterized protein n=1 Tax=Schistosoma mattheei TaxID=31246 RepID=A0A183NRH9_9TREM|nr:unnamed protein product [Schistosoma mattheei]